MRYIPNTDQDRRRMLDAIGVGSVGELFADIPDELRLRRPLKVPAPLSEAEVVRRLRSLALSLLKISTQNWRPYWANLHGTHSHSMPRSKM